MPELTGHLAAAMMASAQPGARSREHGDESSLSTCCAVRGLQSQGGLQPGLGGLEAKRTPEGGSFWEDQAQKCHLTACPLLGRLSRKERFLWFCSCPSLPPTVPGLHTGKLGGVMEWGPPCHRPYHNNNTSGCPSLRNSSLSENSSCHPHPWSREPMLGADPGWLS